MSSQGAPRPARYYGVFDCDAIAPATIKRSGANLPLCMPHDSQ